jgi:hypothetical protein
MTKNTASEYSTPGSSATPKILGIILWVEVPYHMTDQDFLVKAPNFMNGHKNTTLGLIL